MPYRLDGASEGVDYQLSPGGVSRMVGGLLRRLTTQGRISHGTWVSLAKTGPTSVVSSDRVALEHVRLPADLLLRYAVAKGVLWKDIHGIDSSAGPGPGASRWEIHRGLSFLAAAMGRRAHELHERNPFDLFYVHDFQLLPLAQHLPEGVPRVFRWHIPMPAATSPYMPYIVDCLNRYDAVIVSTVAYAERLVEAGVKVPVHARYPYLDEARERIVTGGDVAAFSERWGLASDDALFLLVARMDPIKSHDVAIKALARIAEECPQAKLMLVGDGGFSGDRRGGLGMNDLAVWQDDLRALAKSLGLEDRVIFTGNLPDHDVDVAYTRARAVLLPSRLEGFGLATVEGWLYGKPGLVSRGAGVAELIEEGVNGHAFEPGDVDALAAHMRRLAEDPAAAAAMGRSGRETARTCHLAQGADGVWRILSDAIKRGRSYRFAQGDLLRRS